MRRWTQIVSVSFVCAISLTSAPLDAVYERMYSFDFEAAHILLDQIEQEQGRDPLYPVTRAAVYLFQEMDRLGILASEFYQDKGERLRRQKIEPSGETYQALLAALEDTRQRAKQMLETRPNNADAHFALALAAGVECNYRVFVEKKRFATYPLAKQSHNHALRTLDADPDYYDAYLIPGLNEYVVGNLPFFIQWFVHFERVEGKKEKAVDSLERVAQSGRYLHAFARILLATIHIREERLEEARQVTAELAAKYPENPLFRQELDKLNQKVKAAVKAEL